MFLELVSNEKNNLGNYIWKYIVGIIIVFIGLVVGYAPLIFAIFSSGAGPAEIEEFTKTMDFAIVGIDSNLGLILLIASFAIGLLALFIVVKVLHNKKFKNVISSQPRIRWDRIFYGFLIWMGLSTVIELISYFMYPENYQLIFDLELFLPLVIISLLLLPIQTSFEEIFLRGYVMQGIGLIGVYRVVPLLITSLIFGLLHIANPEIERFGFEIMMTFYITFGLVLGIITIMDDGLEIPLGIHAANNIFAAAFVSYSGGALQTPAIFRVSDLNPQSMFLTWIAVSIVALFLFSKKYNWAGWSKLFAKIDFDPNVKDQPKDMVKEDFFEIENS